MKNNFFSADRRGFLFAVDTKWAAHALEGPALAAGLN